jgi:glycerol-3-phosphate dehydrogenase
MTEKYLTEKQVRGIAREEALKVQKEVLKEITDVKDTLARLERLLLGELGTDQEDTLKARANIAYSYAKKNIDSKIIERAAPALEWFEDWDRPEKGCKESKLESLGKLVTFYLNVRWLLALIGVTTLLNAIPVIKVLVTWVSNLTP